MKADLISRRSFLSVVGAVGAAALTACGGSASSTASSTAASEAAGESVELIVFAAASLTETLNAIAQDYSAENPGVTFRFNFDSSGTLKTQIQEGADCDLFISAGQKQMNQLDITASADVNTDGLDFVDPSTRVARPGLRPFWSLRYLVRLGCSIAYSPSLAGAAASASLLRRAEPRRAPVRDGRSPLLRRPRRPSRSGAGSIAASTPKSSPL